MNNSAFGKGVSISKKYGTRAHSEMMERMQTQLDKQNQILMSYPNSMKKTITPTEDKYQVYTIVPPRFLWNA
jgi:hypothetical protein